MPGVRSLILSHGFWQSSEVHDRNSYSFSITPSSPLSDASLALALLPSIV